MSEFLTEVELIRDKAVAKLRTWSDEEAATRVQRKYLSEEGMYVKSGSKLSELLDARHRLALTAEDETVKLKAIDSSLQMAAGSEKVNVQNNTQINFGDFLDNLK